MWRYISVFSYTIHVMYEYRSNLSFSWEYLSLAKILGSLLCFLCPFQEQSKNNKAMGNKGQSLLMSCMSWCLTSDEVLTWSAYLFCETERTPEICEILKSWTQGALSPECCVWGLTLLRKVTPTNDKCMGCQWRHQGVHAWGMGIIWISINQQRPYSLGTVEAWWVM